ncbi:MAG: DUF1232 domain-containing protein [Deltaproteobacteria bacterium]|nr:DUF1232 domain-containing protein [Deltaproteobacteria bacterium]
MSPKLKAYAYALGALTSLVYLLNPGAGVFELLPDALPLVGNLDEAAFAALLLTSIRGFRKLGRERKLSKERRLATADAG